jgi:vitamin B12 transporter
MKRFLLPLSAALSLSPAFAQEPTNSSLPTVVVTATRLPDIPAPLPNNTVITREEIAARGALTLVDVLQQEAGLIANNNGGPLTTGGIFLRGSAGKQVLVLVDGVRMNDANQGAFDLSLLRADDIERIEITRGPYSAKYGSDAIGGVIQVFTRKSAKAEVSVRGGRFNTQEYNAGVRAGDARNGIGLRVGYLDTDGFNATLPGSFAFNPDRDGGLARTVQLNGDRELGDGVRAGFSSSWKEGRSEFDSGLNEQELGTASASLEHDVTDNWAQTLRFGWLLNNLDIDGRSDPFFPYFSRFRTERNSASWLHDVEWMAGWHAVAGVDFMQEQAQSRDLLAGATIFDQELENTGVFLTQYAEAGIISGSASVRVDDHDSFGSHTTGSATLAARVLPSTKLFAGYGTAFRAPSANDLYYPGDASFCFPPTPGVKCYAGNPALQPEKSKNGEVGIEFRAGEQRVRLSAYRNRVRDLIVTGSAFPYPLVNEARARLQGIELDAGGKVAALTWRASAGSQSAEDAQGNDLIRRPQGTFNGLLQVDLSDRLNAGTEVRARSSSKDAGMTLGGYTVFNVYANWQVLPSLDLGARLENAGNKAYQEVAGYRTAPRSGYITARYVWR